MSHYTDKNERLNRQAAFMLALSLHAALAVALYFQTNEKPAVGKTPTAAVAAAPAVKKPVPTP